MLSLEAIGIVADEAQLDAAVQAGCTVVAVKGGDDTLFSAGLALKAKVPITAPPGFSLAPVEFSSLAISHCFRCCLAFDGVSPRLCCRPSLDARFSRRNAMFSYSTHHPTFLLHDARSSTHICFV